MAGIAVPITLADASGVEEALRLGADADSGGADLIEWRVDRLASQEAGPAATERLVRESPLPSIVTCRAADEGGTFEGTEAERVGLLDHLADTGAVPAFIDVEYARWIASSDLGDVTDALRRAGARVILSAHDFSGRPDRLDDIFARIEETQRADVTKVAWQASSVRDALECAERLADCKQDTIALCMGMPGLLTRIFANTWGSLLTFAALEEGAESAPGQPTLEELNSIYRIATIDRDTKLHAIVRDGVDIRSENATLRDSGTNAVAVPLGPVSAQELDATEELLRNSPFVHLGRFVS